MIEPKNDAGNGERLILFGRYMPDESVTSSFVTKTNETHKVLISIPSYARAVDWASFGNPPARAEFTEKLKAFREAQEGAFILVSRVDGIDLPHNTCRVMLIDDIPIGTTLLERLQWEQLDMLNLNRAKVANRVTQLFGRINRGRNDYGVFLINGSRATDWLINQKNRNLLPDLIDKQIRIGLHLQRESGAEEMESDEGIQGLINKVIRRDNDWINYYSRALESLSSDEEENPQTDKNELRLTHAAIAEVAFMSSLWVGQYPRARENLKNIIQETARADSSLSGWHNLWIGMTYHAEGDEEAEYIEYDRARTRLRHKIPLPEKKLKNSGSNEELSRTQEHLSKTICVNSDDTYQKQLAAAGRELEDLENPEASVNRKEEAMRSLGEWLGFDASRPDNDVGTGPDVLWIDDNENVGLAFELKTEKDTTIYSKSEISQAHDHKSWLAKSYPEISIPGIIFIGPEGHADARANPSADMFQCSIDEAKHLKD